MITATMSETITARSVNSRASAGLGRGGSSTECAAGSLMRDNLARSAAPAHSRNPRKLGRRRFEQVAELLCRLASDLDHFLVVRNLIGHAGRVVRDARNAGDAHAARARGERFG